VKTTVLVLAVLTSGLMAGLFTSFAYAVMPGLGRTSDAVFVDAMKQINVAILNGWFGICFGGALVFSLLAAVLLRSPWAIAGAVLYVLVLVISFAVNVPLNNRLDAATGDPTTIRAAFEFTWVTWNILRAVVSTAAFTTLAWSLHLA
jgi:uncharacterized membrane protein